MIQIIINGIEKQLEGEAQLNAILEAEGYADKIVAVAVNGVFVSKKDYAETGIKDGDQIEIVAPMQGG